jgi:NitT/TauT family transport system substrate-binding protein
MSGLLLLSASAAMAELRLAVSKTPLSLPLYVAAQKGFFAEQGLDVKLAACEGGYRCLKEMLAGRADIATVGDLPIVLNSFERTDYAVIGTLVTSSDDVKLIAHARSRISKPLHLAGKRVGAVIGSASQYFLELYLLTAGVDPQGVTLVALQPEHMLAALQGGEVDAVAIWEPHAYLSTKALGSSAVVLPHASGYLLTFNLVAHRRLVGARDDDMIRLLKAIVRAERFIQERPDEAKAILRTSLQLDQPFIEWVWGGMAYRLSLDQSLISTMEGEARWARREGHVKGASPNFLGLLHSAPLKAVKPSAVGVNR